MKEKNQKVCFINGNMSNLHFKVIKYQNECLKKFYFRFDFPQGEQKANGKIINFP